MEEVLVLYTTHPDRECARKITKILLEDRLVACGNIYPIESHYWWDDEVVHSEEYVVIYKTRHSLIDKIESVFNDHHPYDVPCIVRYKADANMDYKQWVIQETKRL